VGESSSAAVARQTRHTLTHTVDYGFVDTADASIRAAESRTMTAVGKVNKRVIDLATTQRQETHELQVHYEDASDDQDLVRAQKMPSKRTTTITTAPMTDVTIKALIAQGVVDTLAEIEANRTVEMVMTAMIQKLVAEGQSELLVNALIVTSSNANP
nr:hypothetical protein [Tanacetum cinerariifolium]